MKNQSLFTNIKYLTPLVWAVLGSSNANAQDCSTSGHPDEKIIGQVELLNTRNRTTESPVENYVTLLEGLEPGQKFTVQSKSNDQTLKTFNLSVDDSNPQASFRTFIELNQPDTLVFSVNSPWSGSHEFSRVNIEYERSGFALDPKSISLFDEILSAAPNQKFTLEGYKNGVVTGKTANPAVYNNPQDVIDAMKIATPPDSLILTTKPGLGEVPAEAIPDIVEGLESPGTIGPSLDIPNGQTQGPIDVNPMIQGPIDVSPITTPSSALESTSPSSALESTSNNLMTKIADATVMITFYRTGQSGQSIFDRCNGINIGDARILTAAHCFSSGAKNHVVWFGNIKWNDRHEDGPMRSELACKANRVTSFSPKNSASGELPLDVAMLNVSATRVGQLLPKFLKSPIYIPSKDPWCQSKENCADPSKTQSFIELSVSQVWASDPDLRAIQKAFDDEIYQRGIKTLSINNDKMSCGTRRYLGGAMSPKLLNLICAADKTAATNFSHYGFVHDCDTVPGSSGAPVFSQSNIDAFLKGQISQLPLAGIHRAGDKNRGNCVIPASQFQSDINP